MKETTKLILTLVTRHKGVLIGGMAAVINR